MITVDGDQVNDSIDEYAESICEQCGSSGISAMQQTIAAPRILVWRYWRCTAANTHIFRHTIVVGGVDTFRNHFRKLQIDRVQVTRMWRKHLATYSRRIRGSSVVVAAVASVSPRDVRRAILGRGARACTCAGKATCAAIVANRSAATHRRGCRRLSSNR